MHDIRMIRETPNAFDAALSRRGLAPVSPAILALDIERRAAIKQTEDAQAAANAAAKDVGKARASGDDAEFTRLRTLMADKKAEIATLNERAKELDTQLGKMLIALPNLPYDDVPLGKGENDNVEVKRTGTPRSFDFTPVEHYDIPAVQAGMDFAAGAKLSGSRFVVLSGAVARVHRALAQFMLDTHVDTHGLQETITPIIGKEEMMYGMSRIPISEPTTPE